MQTHIQGQYHGKAMPLFLLYFKTALLTLLTLGIYRFWAKTRIRKYIWSATSGDDDSFEYTGTGLEKFLGFLVAVVILAVYLGVVNILLAYLGLVFPLEPQGPQDAVILNAIVFVNFLAALPLILFAQYRARRYRMARTRWRGLRFGMENGAWGFAGRALWYTFLTVITLGLLAPLGTFRLEKYMADRTWYGDAQFAQGGRWQALYGGMKHVFFGLAVLIGGIAFGALTDSPFITVTSMLVGYVWVLIGLVNYRVFAFNYMTSEKTLDDRVLFSARALTSRVITTYIVGVLLIGLAMAVIMGIIAAMFIPVFQSIAEGGVVDPSLGVMQIVVTAILYVGAFLVAGGLSLVLITQKIIEHMVTQVAVLDEHNHLDMIRQRAADLGADAEGFADALDVGGAI